MFISRYATGLGLLENSWNNTVILSAIWKHRTWEQERWTVFAGGIFIQQLRVIRSSCFRILFLIQIHFRKLNRNKGGILVALGDYKILMGSNNLRVTRLINSFPVRNKRSWQAKLHKKHLWLSHEFWCFCRCSWKYSSEQAFFAREWWKLKFLNVFW